jgi:hypothetical protein
VLTVARLTLVEADFKRLETEKDLHKIADTLSALFVPPQADICLNVLSRFRWDQPDIGIVTSLIQYCDSYDRTSRRLVPPLCGEVITENFVRSLHGSVGKIVAQTKQATGAKVVKDVMAFAMKIAREEETLLSRHPELQQVSLRAKGNRDWSVKHIAQKSTEPPSTTSQYKPTRDDDRQRVRYGPEGLPIGGVAARPLSLMPAIRAYCIQNDLCFLCRKVGHSVADCPEQKATAAIDAGATSGTTTAPESKPHVSSARYLAGARPRSLAQPAAQGKSESARFAEIAQQAADGRPLPPRVPKRERATGRVVAHDASGRGCLQRRRGGGGR